MTVHKEGRKILIILFLFLAITNILTSYLLGNGLISCVFIVVSALIYLFVLRFFRKPNRGIIIKDNVVYAPCDGKVVVIEETDEEEYFKERRIQVSIFMSVWNVHINWFPINGIVKYFKYHPGEFLIARNPKSSTLNERTTVVVESVKGQSLLLRQIAGIVARRIVTYAPEGNKVEQGSEMGFIKFGSRVDLLLPLGTKVNVSLDQKVVGKQTEIAVLG